MDKLLIRGPKRLTGEVTISGAKNAALGVLPAAILLSDVCTIENIPNILDIAILRRIMESLGVRFAEIDPNTLKVDATNVNSYTATGEDMHKFRGSYYLMGALLGRFNKAVVTFPGGCNFGSRPIDQHIKGFEALGAKVEIEHGLIKLSAEKLTGANIYLDVVSVGATVNIMLAAVKAEGVTTIENAAKEPHIVDIANFLNAMGADIKGAGTDIIRIRGVKELKGKNVVHSIIPDQIEAGTYMIAAAATKGDVLVKNVIPKHMESLSAKLAEMNVKVQELDDCIRVCADEPLNRVNIKTLPYPGFPTDLQPIMAVLLLQTNGISTITESIFDNRFQYIDELKRMGAKARVEGRMAVIEGGAKLTGAPVKAVDLRAGAACVLAGLVAEGVTEVSNVHLIDRGYERMVEKLNTLGADIRRISDSE